MEGIGLPTRTSIENSGTGSGSWTRPYAPVRVYLAGIVATGSRCDGAPSVRENITIRKERICLDPLIAVVDPVPVVAVRGGRVGVRWRRRTVANREQRREHALLFGGPLRTKDAAASSLGGRMNITATCLFFIALTRNPTPPVVWDSCSAVIRSRNFGLPARGWSSPHGPQATDTRWGTFRESSAPTARIGYALGKDDVTSPAWREIQEKPHAMQEQLARMRPHSPATHPGDIVLHKPVTMSPLS
jgi:hypothetical protein